jgi:FRG domain
VKSEEKKVTDWSGIWKIYGELLASKRTWIFRGVSNPTYRLVTSLEREAERFGIKKAVYPEIEKWLVRYFMRQAHHFLTGVPADDDPIEWRALMQHHGAPTRLLDWSYSFLVGLYFTVENAEKTCGVWCLDLHWLLRKVESKFKKEFRTVLKEDPSMKKAVFFDSIFDASPPLDLVYSLNPHRLNPRLTIQQGLFLAAGNLTKSFEENFDTIQEDVDRRRVLKVVIDTSDVNAKSEILRHLHRMNINGASLFPGLDGFAQSLKTMLAMPDILKGRSPFE